MIDAHHHLWDPSRRDYPWMSASALDPIRRPYTVDDLRAVARRAGVRSTVLVQTVSSVEETVEFLETAADEPIIAGVVGWVDLTADDIDSQLARLANSGPLVGIRHQVENEADPGWLARPDVIRGLAAIGRAGLAYDLLVQTPQLAAARTAVDALPDMTFVLDHAAKPPIASGAWQPWADEFAKLAERPNVYCKLSGLVTEADWNQWRVGHLRRHAEHVFESFGAQRVMFGSDWPVCELAASYEVVVDAALSLTGPLSDLERAEVFEHTARRAYALES
ncbi:L-fuconolactonase [Amycolatopsis xylanica]|uniref:L-fuconolactonase n=1 Tax=Amycolatopsis xylanica TaxID=589385 RepID=A0A1H3QXN5_9PSEU|nr:amidohydrolase family protein [Amycolatopsis xylanica]SDZ17805.1 L-fuconolactonase [Amycolatopsis xylanica]